MVPGRGHRVAAAPPPPPRDAEAGSDKSAQVITVTFIHPIDTVKTRLQVSGTGNARNYAELGLAGTCSTIAKEEGIAAFWKGIPAAWMREAYRRRRGKNFFWGGGPRWRAAAAAAAAAGVCEDLTMTNPRDQNGLCRNNV